MPKIIDHDQRRLEIVLATEKLIITGGYEAATMREIAAAAGYANGALKRYFDGKDQILMATSKYVSDQLIARLQKVVEGKQGLEAVEQIFEETTPEKPENIGVARVIMAFWERALGNEELRRAFRESLLPWRRLTEKYLTQAVEHGEMSKNLSPEVVADELMTLTIGVHFLVQINRSDTTVHGQTEHIRRRIKELWVDVPMAARYN